MVIFWAVCALYLNGHSKLIDGACGCSLQALCKELLLHCRSELQCKPFGLYVIFS
jgi:hypothetical protein